MAQAWIANNTVQEMCADVVKKFHLPRLEEAVISVALNDDKPFKNDRLNWGAVRKFSEFNKLYQSKPVDFSIVIPMDVWEGILDSSTQKAILDLHLARCAVEFVPETIIENGKKKPVKDEFGRRKYTTEIKRDEAGRPKWTVLPLDLTVFSGNVRRYGLWCEELLGFKEAVVGAK